MFALLKTIWIDATDKGVVSCELYESFRNSFGYDLFVYLLVENATLSLEERKKKKPPKASRRSKPSNVITIPDDDINDRLKRIEKTLHEIKHSQQRIEVALKIEGSSAALSVDADTIGHAAAKQDVDRDDDSNANFDDDQAATTKDDTKKAAGSNEAAKPERKKDGATAKETVTTIAQAAKPNTESKDDDSNAKSDAATAATAKAETKKAAAGKESAKSDSKEEGTAANVTKIPCAAGAKCQCGGFIVTDPGKLATKHICESIL
jgi:hypothetical protein